MGFGVDNRGWQSYTFSISQYSYKLTRKYTKGALAVAAIMQRPTACMRSTMCTRHMCCFTAFLLLHSSPPGGIANVRPAAPLARLTPC